MRPAVDRLLSDGLLARDSWSSDNYRENSVTGFSPKFASTPFKDTPGGPPRFLRSADNWLRWGFGFKLYEVACDPALSHGGVRTVGDTGIDAWNWAKATVRFVEIYSSRIMKFEKCVFDL